MARPPHILLLLCDQYQHGWMSFVDGVSHTPNLDALAKEGIHFTHAYTAQAQCSPSRAAIQTGRYAHETGVMVIPGFWNHQCRLLPRYRTIGQSLKDAGYQTAYFGKMHVGTPPAELGYDVVFENDHGVRDAAMAQERGWGHVPQSFYADYAAVDEAVAFLEGWQPGEQPLFMTFSTNLPHPPFFLEKNYSQYVPPAEELGLPASFQRDTFEGKPAFQQAHSHDSEHSIHDARALQQEMHQYLTMIAAADDHLGRVIAQYKRLGIWEDTFVLFSADHGDMMGSHNLRVKGTLPYDEIYRVPLIVKPHRGVKAGRQVVDDLVSSVSFAGTLAQAAGVDDPALTRHGTLWGSITGAESPTPRDEQRVFFEHYAAYWGLHPFYAIRTSRYKVVRYYGPDDCLEMYDLQADPLELRNIAQDDAHAPARDELLAELDAWWLRTGGKAADHYESPAFKAFATLDILPD